MVPSRAHVPSVEPAEANGLPEAYAPPHWAPKVHGPRGHFTPLPPFSGPDNTQKHFYDQLFLFF